jgi:hypothetical protein
VRLAEGALTIEQSGSLPDLLMPEKRGSVTLTVERKSAGTVVYRVN